MDLHARLTHIMRDLHRIVDPQQLCSGAWLSSIVWVKDECNYWVKFGRNPTLYRQL